MKMFLDSAKTDEIRYALDLWDIDGITTNPKHVKDSGKPFRTVIEEIAGLFDGTTKEVSVEVDPNLADWEKMVDQGLELSKISPNFVIKVGVSEQGFKAIRELTNRGVRVNATLIFSVAQAWQAARAGAAFVSPFVGWKEQYGDPVESLIPEVAVMLENYDYRAEIIAAAVRNSRHIAEAALAGAHCITAGMAVYQDSFRNPYTTMGEQLFQNAWNATPEQ
ncbi:MAG: transaldolase [Planctomycetaceae bacterium]|nr:transaldolase [Planctomycetaceae bacterium]